MKNTWWLGVAAFVAGCASEGQVDTRGPGGVMLQPVDTALGGASIDQRLPAPATRLSDTAALVAGADVVLDALPTATALPCATAAASAATMATAQPLGACVHGALAEADAGQHFVFDAEPGVSYLVALSRPGDARFDLGVVTTTEAGSTCSLLSSGLISTRVMSDGTASTLCAIVRSESGAAQDYRLTVTR